MGYPELISQAHYRLFKTQEHDVYLEAIKLIFIELLAWVVFVLVLIAFMLGVQLYFGETAWPFLKRALALIWVCIIAEGSTALIRTASLHRASCLRQKSPQSN